jgi:hypothetical protein
MKLTFGDFKEDWLKNEGIVKHLFCILKIIIKVW